MHRRHFLSLAAAGAASLSLPSAALAQRCPGRTDPNIEGPFYRPGAPPVAALTDAPNLELFGTVRDVGCRPMADAAIEVWQADANGDYDLSGYRYRGVMRTDAEGRWRLSTVVPGRYLNGATYRPAHVHVKVHATGRPPLTTQLYFPGDPHNDDDPWFRASLVVQRVIRPSGCSYRATPEPQRARFDFVV